MACALTLLAIGIRNDWGQILIVVGLVMLGLAQGCIVALVFNTLLSSSPKELAGDVGAWRGLTHNISGSVGIAISTAVAVSLLATVTFREARNNPAITPALIEQVNVDTVNFVTNAQLQDFLDSTPATPQERSQAVIIYEEARLRALRTTLLLLAVVSLLAIVPAGRMPGFQRGDLPVGYPGETKGIDAGAGLRSAHG